jgi:hypothetical protein
MSTSDDTGAVKAGRDFSLGEEQIFCRHALESGTYDSMSDKAWVALCEGVATDAREAKKLEASTAQQPI